jgi:hypothetical protein
MDSLRGDGPGCDRRVRATGTDSVRQDEIERDKQITTALLKEAEFIRNEILSIGASARTLLVGTVAFIGVLLTSTAGLLTVKVSDGNGVNHSAPTIESIIQSAEWPLLLISIVGVIVYFIFLWLYLSRITRRNI